MNFKIQKISQASDSIYKTPTLTYISSNNSLLLYGHELPPVQLVQPQKKSFTFKVDKVPQQTTEMVKLYSLQRRQWWSQQVKGKIPSNRINQLTLFMEPCLILFGGKSQATPPKLHNDLYALNCSNWIWKKLFSLEGPPAYEDYHMCKINENKIVLIGKQIWCLSLKDVKWDLNGNQLPGAVWQKIDIIPKIKTMGLFAHDQSKIYIFSQNYTISMLNLNDKTLTTTAIKYISTEQKKPQQISLLSNITNEQLIMLADNSISIFKVPKNDQIQIIQEQTVDHLWVCADIAQGLIYTLTAKGELYQINSSQLRTKRQLYPSLVNHNNSCIIQQSQQSSAFYEKENQLQQNSRQEQLPLSIDGRFSEEAMKDHLSGLLAYQHFKRKLLQAKSKSLQQAIKKSQKMVLILCKYGQQKQKKNHIQSVKSIRQELQTVWGKETYYRKQIENRKNIIPLNQLLQQHLSEAFSQFFN